MPVKRKAPEKGKQERLDASVQIGLSQLNLPGMSLMSLLRFGSDLLLKEAIKAEITAYLGRQHHSLAGADHRARANRSAVRCARSRVRRGRILTPKIY